MLQDTRSITKIKCILKDNSGICKLKFKNNTIYNNIQNVENKDKFNKFI